MQSETVDGRGKSRCYWLPARRLRRKQDCGKSVESLLMHSCMGVDGLALLALRLMNPLTQAFKRRLFDGQ